MHASRPAPLAAAAALALALTLAGCASDTTADSATDATMSASAMEKDPSATAMAKESPSAMESESAMEKESESAEAMATEGNWIDQAAYEADPASFHANGDVVLFFNATWCPTCKQAVKNLDADGVPAGLTVVSVDYDDNTDLKKQYGVTVQHTFVQVDESGAPKAKFSGTLTGADIAAQLA